MDKLTGKCNRAIQHLFGYILKQPLENLKIEPDDSDGYVILEWEDLLNPSNDLVEKTEKGIFREEFPLIREQLEKLVI